MLNFTIGPVMSSEAVRAIGDFCKRNDIFLVVDSISSFLCDPFNMSNLGVQVMACRQDALTSISKPSLKARIFWFLRITTLCCLWNTAII